MELSLYLLLSFGQHFLTGTGETLFGVQKMGHITLQRSMALWTRNYNEKGWKPPTSVNFNFFYRF